MTGDRFGFISQGFFNIGVAIIIAFIFGWQLTLLVLTFLPFIASASLLQLKFQQGNVKSQKSSQESIGKVGHNLLGNIKSFFYKLLGTQELRSIIHGWMLYKLSLLFVYLFV